MFWGVFLSHGHQCLDKIRENYSPRNISPKKPRENSKINPFKVIPNIHFFYKKPVYKKLGL